jgi:hypothetical protein
MMTMTITTKKMTTTIDTSSRRSLFRRALREKILERSTLRQSSLAARIMSLATWLSPALRHTSRPTAFLRPGMPPKVWPMQTPELVDRIRTVSRTRSQAVCSLAVATLNPTKFQYTSEARSIGRGQRSRGAACASGTFCVGLFLIPLCGSHVLYAQQPCATQRLELEDLTNQLRALEGLPKLGASPGSTLPKPMQPDSIVPPNTYDPAAITAWHKAHDAEVAQLTAVLETKACALPPPPVPPYPYDLMYSETDDTGVALDPEWKSTMTAPFFSAPDPAQCGGGNPWQSPCTSQQAAINNNKGLCPTGELGGHANFIPATYVGRLTWESHSLESQDDDYNFGLLPLIPQSPTPWITAADDPVAGLHLEFSSDETIDHFHTPWWNSFHAAVDSDDSRSIDNPFGQPRRELVSGTSRALAMIQGNYAIVTGLVGLDCAHSCGAEIHPVWAMAIHVKDDPNDDTWAFFARNGGNEGYCGSKTELLNTTTFTFRLPWRPGATQASIAGQNFLWRGAKTAGGTFDPEPNTGVLISFSLAPPGQGDRMNGELHLKWAGQPQAEFLSSVVATPSQGPKSAKQDPEDDPEISAAIAFSKLTSQQRALVLQKLPQRDSTPDSQVSTLKSAHVQPRLNAPTVTSAPDVRGVQRMQQRVEAIDAAKTTVK